MTNEQKCETEQEKGNKGAFAGVVDKVKKELDSFVESTWNQGGKAVDVLLSGKNPFGSSEPEIDLIETAESIIVFANVPGTASDAFDVSLVGNILSLKGIVAELQTAESDVIHRQQRRTGSFNANVAMPVSVNPDEITAELRDGVLKLTLAKAQTEKTHTIKINTN